MRRYAPQLAGDSGSRETPGRTIEQQIAVYLEALLLVLAELAQPVDLLRAYACNMPQIGHYIVSRETSQF
jgi:hypothetical protein